MFTKFIVLSGLFISLSFSGEGGSGGGPRELSYGEEGGGNAYRFPETRSVGGDIMTI